MFYILATKGFQVKKKKKLHTQPRATSFDLVKILVCEKSLKEDGVFSAGKIKTFKREEIWAYDYCTHCPPGGTIVHL